MTPTINVNLKQCDCQQPRYTQVVRGCIRHAEHEPVLVPCPIPRSVTFAVALGECACPKPGHMLLPRTVGFVEGPHALDCPARPVRVACSISGETWEDSIPHGFEAPELAYVPPEAVRAVRDRWALVKALVLDRAYPQEPRPGPWIQLREQRDAVFAALADMARTEASYTEMHRTLFRLLDKSGVSWATSIRVAPSIAADGLVAYVEHLIEQVGSL